jgi:hypothetical protein
MSNMLAPATQRGNVQRMDLGYVSRSRRHAIGYPALVGGGAGTGKLQVVLQLRMGAHQQKQIHAA